MSELRGTDYVEGRKFRVVKEGARFEGLLLHGEQTVSGWSRRISQGEVLTCLGWKSVDVFGACLKGVMWTGAKVPDSAIVMQIWPFESIFRPYPLTGFLERQYTADDEDYPADLLKLDRKQIDRQLLGPFQPALDEIDDGAEVDLTSHLPILDLPKPEINEEVLDLSDYR